jgi:ribosomal-protein-alanine N-acetyltransferase
MNYSIFQHHPLLVCEGILLKELSVADAEIIDEISSYRLTAERLSGKELLDKLKREYESKTGINWGIYISNELAGTIGFYRGFENDEGEIGFVIREKFRKQGIAFKTLTFLTQFGLSVIQLSKINAYTSEGNIASKNLLTKAGFFLVETDIEEYIKYTYIN